MIYVNLSGRLGNQLFQYACARALQEKYNQKICFYTYELEKFGFENELTNYKLNENIFFVENKKLPFFKRDNILSKLMNKLNINSYFKILRKFGIFVWKKRTYIDIFNKEFKNFYLDGFWQSDKYFENIKKIIIKELTPKQELLKKNYELFNNIRNSQSVCVTIRSGDYISNESNYKRYFICDKKYFYDAIDVISKKIDNPVLFIFSDDIEWAKENLKFNFQTYFESGDDTVFEKIRLMCNCKHFIISNSSFSWWAQFLGNYSNKYVVAPKKWYNFGEEPDIFQDNWIKI